MNERDDVINTLRRLFKGGLLRRMPRSNDDSQIIMALSLLGLDPNQIYDESDINVELSAWLDGIADENGTADYVAMRRDLVDHGFLRRATDGAIYRISRERIDDTLSEAARSVNPKAIFTELELERHQRKEAFRQ